MGGDPMPARGPVRLACETGRRVDLGTVDALARVALSARRLGRDVEVVGAPDLLRGLIDLAGLAEVVACVSGSARELER